MEFGKTVLAELRNYGVRVIELARKVGRPLDFPLLAPPPGENVMVDDFDTFLELRRRLFLQSVASCTNLLAARDLVADEDVDGRGAAQLAESVES